MNDSITRALKHCCEALDAKKVADLKVLDLRGKSTITDYFILATATSEPHLRALRRILEEVIEEEKVKVVGIDYHAASGWMVVDAFQFMVHLFTEEQRNNYNLEALWQDGTLIDWKSL